jgi:RNA polymerase sigma-70 factor (sigma-E family)
MRPDDEAQFRAFVSARSPALLATARLLAADRHAAEDLLQDALARLVPRWSRIEDPEAYARVTMHRLSISRWRRRAVVREDSHEVPPDPAGGAGRTVLGTRGDAGTGPIRQVDDRMALRAALARLAPRQRAVLVARYVEDLDERAAAAALGISVGTVRSTSHRALARLRQLAPELDAAAPEPPPPGPAHSSPPAHRPPPAHPSHSPPPSRSSEVIL